MIHKAINTESTASPYSVSFECYPWLWPCVQRCVQSRCNIAAKSLDTSLGNTKKWRIALSCCHHKVSIHVCLSVCICLYVCMTSQEHLLHVKIPSSLVRYTTLCPHEEYVKWYNECNTMSSWIKISKLKPNRLHLPIPVTENQDDAPQSTRKLHQSATSPSLLFLRQTWTLSFWVGDTWMPIESIVHLSKRMQIMQTNTHTHSRTQRTCLSFMSKHSSNIHGCVKKFCLESTWKRYITANNLAPTVLPSYHKPTKPCKKLPETYDGNMNGACTDHV